MMTVRTAATVLVTRPRHNRGAPDTLRTRDHGRFGPLLAANPSLPPPRRDRLLPFYGLRP